MFPLIFCSLCVQKVLVGVRTFLEMTNNCNTCATMCLFNNMSVRSKFMRVRSL